MKQVIGNLMWIVLSLVLASSCTEELRVQSDWPGSQTHNNPPECEATPSELTVPEGGKVPFAVSCTDPDGDSLSYFIGENAEVLLEADGGRASGRCERYFEVLLRNGDAKLRKNQLVKVRLLENRVDGMMGAALR